MRLTARGRQVVGALTITTAALAGATAPLWNPYTRALDCRTFDVPEDVNGAGNPHAELLLAQGWRGRPDDHAERLYSPACR